MTEYISHSRVRESRVFTFYTGIITCECFVSHFYFRIYIYIPCVCLQIVIIFYLLYLLTEHFYFFCFHYIVITI